MGQDRIQDLFDLDALAKQCSADGKNQTISSDVNCTLLIKQERDSDRAGLKPGCIEEQPDERPAPN